MGFVAASDKLYIDGQLKDNVYHPAGIPAMPDHINEGVQVFDEATFIDRYQIVPYVKYITNHTPSI